ncbi:hypothetical protein N7492_009666 [Penicillium capsulatum]|uniref:Uncharacterized protein n=1 Tax=Penicillium capsulatum TaxID=69766 RepID=A0A9W9HS74_9EURO|nr:hypothetical protein N7492_009666 [Penicillium capsulatum]
MGVLASGDLASRSHSEVVAARMVHRRTRTWRASNRKRPANDRAGSSKGNDSSVTSEGCSSWAMLLLKLDDGCLPCTPDLVQFVLLWLAFG